MNPPTQRPRHLRHHARRAWGGLWPYVAAALIVTALVGVSLRLGLPWLETTRPELESWLSATLKHPVSIGSLHVRWRHWTPQVVLRDVTLKNPDTGETVVRLNDVRTGLSLTSSIVHLRPVPDRLIVHGQGFALFRDEQGRIRVEGIKARRGLDLATIFFTPARIEIRTEEMIWEDKLLGTPPVKLSDVAVRLRNAENRHQMDGQATLPGDSAHRIRFAMDLSGNPSSSDWHAQVYLSAQGMPLRMLPVDQLHPQVRIVAGEANLQSWLTWRHARLTSAETRFRLVGMHASFAEEVVPLRWARGTVSYSRDGDDWQLAVDHLDLVTSRGRWPQSRVEVAVTGDRAARQVAGRVGFLNLEYMLPAVRTLVPLDPEIRDWLQAARPSGEIRDVTFLYRPYQPSGNRLLLKTRLDAIELQPHADQPGFKGLSGSLQVGKGKGRLRLDSYALEVDFPRMFPKPIHANTAVGELRWERTGEGWRSTIEHLEISNLDVLIHLAGSLEWGDAYTSPFLDIRARFEDGNLEAMPDYLPVRVMRRRLHAWMVRAIPTGVITDGGLVLRGHAADFPFDQAQGRFEVRANLAGAILDYSPRWPRLEEIDAEIVFNGRSMSFYSTAGKLFDAELLEAHGRIPDVRAKPSELEFRAKVRSPGGDGLRFLMESPLEKKFRPALGDAEISGDVAIGLNLGLTLSRKIKTHHIQGTLSFEDNDVSAKTVGLELQALSGTLNFTADSLTGEGLAANVWGLPITLSVEDLEAAGQPLTRFNAEGRVSADQLAELMQGHLLRADETSRRLSNRMQGETTWRISLDVPETFGQEGAVSTLMLESDLTGMALAYPEPLGKTSDEARRLMLGIVFGGSRPNEVRLGYGEDLRAALALRQEGGLTKFTRGAIYLGKARGELPETDGLFVYADVERFSSTAWLEVLSPAEKEETAEAPQASAARSASPLKQLDIKAREFELVGQWNDNLHLQARQESDGTWRARIHGNTIAGTVVIPSTETGQPASMVFERLALNAPKKNGFAAGEQDPRTLPPLELSCDEFSIGDLPLGTLSLVTRPHAGGLRIEELTVVGEDFRLEASGDWWSTEGEPMSRFQIRITSDNQGDLLKRFGYDEVFKGGEAELVIDANWRGSPGEFALARINGLVYYRADDGRVADLEPGGAGRVFGLLSVHALPRRLRLDFSDAFKEGFSYDRIEGNFTLYEGNAYTNDLYVSAPAARINIAGRVGLATQDYDQLVTVTPEVSSTFAIGGALAAGPVGAATALLAQHLFKGQINKSVERQYKVTGNWADPQIVRLGQPSADADGDDAES